MQGIPPTPPEVYWAIIALLVSAVGALFWQLQKANEKYVGLLEKSFGAMMGLQVTMASMVEAVEALEDAAAHSSKRAR